MTKYLIIALIAAVILLSAISFLSHFFNTGKPQTIPLPILTAPSASPASSYTPSSNSNNDIAPAEQIEIQSKADQDFAEKTKQMNDAYPWLSRLPIQTQNYYVYFDVSEKQFIAKLYPNSSSATPIDQQVETMKNEIKSKLQNLIPDYIKYNIRWDVKPE